MAEIDTLTLSRDLSDIRREGVEHTNEIVKESLKGAYSTNNSVEVARADLSKQVDAIDDTLTDKFFTVARDTMDLRAQVTGVGYQVRDGFVAIAKDAEINALKTQIEMAKQSTYISDKIDADGEKTRHLINELKNADLNRMLIERNNEIMEHRHDGRHWRGQFDNAQYAGLVSQINALNSSFQDSKQSMVNFGSMLGTSQAATNNSVR